MDMSTSYIEGAQELYKLPQAAIVLIGSIFAKKMTEAVNQIRRKDQKQCADLN